jgi:hypothetical protein
VFANDGNLTGLDPRIPQYRPVPHTGHCGRPRAATVRRSTAIIHFPGACPTHGGTVGRRNTACRRARA